MAAGGFKEFVAGETLDQDEINDFLMQGVLVFAGTAARGSAITAPVEGQFSFLADSDTVQFYDGSAWVDLSTSFDMEILTIGGGGGAAGSDGQRGSGGGGAGGLLNETVTAKSGDSFTVTVGAGGNGGSSGNNRGQEGVSSVAILTSIGGGGGIPFPGAAYSKLAGACGGGSGSQSTSDQPGGHGYIGFDGGEGFSSGDINSRAGGGGGGMSAVGADASSATGGAGGAGLANDITGSSVTYAGGGGGGGNSTNGAGGSSIGGSNGSAGATNTGSGGGGRFTVGAGGNGGSGVVILRYPSGKSLTIGAGLTSSTATDGDFKVTTFTAGTDTVTFD